MSVPQNSWNSACIRVDHLDDYYQHWLKLNWQLWPEACMTGQQDFAEIRQFCILDINGSLLRCIEVQDTAKIQMQP